MAVEITPLGFKKPDGVTELVKNGATVIADNAQKAQDLLADTRARVGVVEAAAGSGLSADPDYPGLYFFASPNITEDPTYTGLYTF